MGICSRCGQPLTEDPHVCPVAITAPSPDRQVRGNIAFLAILLLSFALFASTFSFVLLHPAVAGQPILIQTATPTNIGGQGQQLSPTASATPATRLTETAKPGGSGGPAVTPTATPHPMLKPTATPPPPTDTPTPLPTRGPQ
jgi:hypothetical protein